MKSFEVRSLRRDVAGGAAVENERFVIDVQGRRARSREGNGFGGGFERVNGERLFGPINRCFVFIRDGKECTVFVIGRRRGALRIWRTHGEIGRVCWEGGVRDVCGGGYVGLPRGVG
jgi:hypothetical protein